MISLVTRNANNKATTFIDITLNRVNIKVRINEYLKAKSQVNLGKLSESDLQLMAFELQALNNELVSMIYDYNTKHYMFINASHSGPAFGGGQ